MKVLLRVLTGVAVIVGVLIVIGFFLPNAAHVERRITIQAPPSVVFSVVNDIKAFNQWSPWARIDPDTKYIFEGPQTGIGARMVWASDNPGVGSGSQEIIESEPDRRVAVALDFGEQGNGTAYYDIQPEGINTLITWGFDTQFGYDLVGRYFGLMLDKLVGAEYDKGLSNLKVLVERQEGEGT